MHVIGQKWWRKGVGYTVISRQWCEVLQKGYTRDEMCVFHYEMSLKSVHIPGPSNTQMRSLVVFLSQVPHVAALGPTEVPQAVIDPIIRHYPD